jgi:hypothetical protein
MEDGAGKTGGDYVRAVIWERGEHCRDSGPEFGMCGDVGCASLSLSVCVRLVSWILYFLDFMIYPHLAI